MLDAIVTRAQQLVGGYSGTLWRRFGDELILSAYTTTNQAGITALLARSPMPINDWDFCPRELHAGRVVMVADTETAPEMPEVWRDVARKRGYRARKIIRRRRRMVGRRIACPQRLIGGRHEQDPVHSQRPALRHRAQL